MPTRRQQRINGMLFEELSLLVPNRLDDPRLTLLQVTRVETTQDLSAAKVYVTTVGSTETAADALDALAHAEGFLRSELSLLGLRRLPRLVFAQDKAYESGERVLKLIHGLDEPENSVDAPSADATAVDATAPDATAVDLEAPADASGEAETDAHGA